MTTAGPLSRFPVRLMRQLGLLLLCLALLLPLTGCWNRRELDTLGIVLGLGIDKTESSYRVSVQVVDPGQVSVSRPASPGHSPVVLFRSEADTLFEAVRKMSKVSPRKIYLSHIRVLILGEAFAREGVGKAMDFLSRDSEMRTDFFLLVAKNTTAENILKVFTPLSNIPAYKIYDALLTSSRAWAPSTTVTLDRFIDEIAGTGIDPVLTSIEVAGEQKKGENPRNVSRISGDTFIQTAGLAVFRKDKLVGYLDEEESIGYNYIMNQVRSSVTSIPCESEGRIAFENVHSKTKVKSKLRDEEPVIEVKMDSQVNLGEVLCKHPASVPANVKKLERSLQKHRIELMEAAVKRSREYHVDIFGFGHTVYHEHPAYWKKIRQDWDRHFQTLQIDYKADIQILKVGTVFDPFYKDVKE